MKLTLTYAHHPHSKMLAQHLLSQGHEVQLLTPPALMPEVPFWAAHMPVIPCDFASSVLLKKHLHGQDVVLNLHGAPSTDEDPVRDSLSVFHAALQNDVRVIHFSTHRVYGTPLYVPIDEHHPLMGSDLLTQASIATDMLAKSFAQSFSLPIVVLRLFPVLSDLQLWGLLDYLCHIQDANVNKATQAELENVYLDVLRENDLLHCLNRLLDRQDYQGQVLNVASGRLLSTRLLQKIAQPYADQLSHWIDSESLSSVSPGIVMDYAGYIQRCNGRQGDPDPIRQWLGWEAQHTTPEALKIALRLQSLH
jgi:nucleoside-diphosphate-sugar epimerase